MRARAAVEIEKDVISTPVRTIVAAHSSAGLFSADRMLLESVRGLQEAGCRVVVALPVSGPLVHELEQIGAEVTIMPMLSLRQGFFPPRRWPSLARQLIVGAYRIWQLLGQDRPEVVYVSTLAIPQWPLIARCRGIRSISHLHEAERSRSPLGRRLLYLPHLASQRTFVSTRFSLETVRRTLPALARTTEILRNGIVSPADPALPREPLEEPVRLLYMGHLSARKGPDLAIEAAALLQQEGRSVELTVLGISLQSDDQFAQQLREQAQRTGVNVEFAGFHTDIWPFLASADLLLVPSRFDEHSANPVIEAVLALRPVIASDSSALTEAADGFRTVRLAAPGDAQAIANSVIATTDAWSSTVRALSTARDRALHLYGPGPYRAAIVRACGADDAARGSQPRSTDDG